MTRWFLFDAFECGAPLGDTPSLSVPSLVVVSSERVRWVVQSVAVFARVTLPNWAN